MKSDAELEALKTLVIAFGPREASRQSGLNVNTVLSLARRRKWRKATSQDASSPSAISCPQTLDSTSASTPPQLSDFRTQSPSTALSTSLQRLKSRSLTGLAVYSARAAEVAAKHPKPLEISRKAKDVSDVHKALWPQENQRSDILQIGILIGLPPEE